MKGILCLFLSLTLVKVNNALEEEEPSVFSIKSLIPDPQTPWPKKTIVYAFNTTEKDTYYPAHFHEAKAEIMSRTCIRFKERTNETDYLLVVNKTTAKCSNQVGKKGGPQILNLGSYANRRTHFHELLHSLGFGHEHNRHDRDLFVTINSENIRQGMKEYFKKANSSEVWESTIPYDYNSVLHFSRKEGTKNCRDTITPLEHSVKIGEGYELSVFDVQKINKLYCPGTIGIEIQNVATGEYFDALDNPGLSDEQRTYQYPHKWTVDWYAMRNVSRGSTMTSWSQPWPVNVVKVLSENVTTGEISTRKFASHKTPSPQIWRVENQKDYPNKTRWQIVNNKTLRCLSSKKSFPIVTELCDWSKTTQLWSIYRIFEKRYDD